MASVPGGGSLLNPLFQVISFGAGTAMGPVLRPTLQDLSNEIWQLHQVRPFGPELAAALEAAGIWTPDQAAQEGAYTGFSGGRMADLMKHALRYPDTAELLELWRRDRLTAGEVGLALQRAGIPDTYRAAVLDLFTGRLDPSIIAVAGQRGVMDDAGLLPVGPPSAVGVVRPMPVSPLDTLAEAKAHGIDAERLAVLMRIVGLPASPDLAARMVFRGIIERADFDRAISEGNTRNEWADSLFEGFREIPTARDFVQLHLRGWTDEAGMLAGAHRHGMRDADTDVLFKITGRPISFHQVFIGERRGGTYDGPTTAIDPAFLKSLRESNIRPEWYNLAWAQRHTYPSAFVLRALTQAGDLTQAEAQEILLFIGWPEALATKVSERWSGVAAGATVTAGPRVKAAQTSAITEIRSAFLIGQADETQARDWLGRIGVEQTEIDGMLPIWSVMLEVPQKGLSASQIKKAYRNLPAAWPRTRALDALESLGLTADDAATILDE